MERPNDFNQYLTITADKNETPVLTISDDYFTITCPRFDTRTGTVNNPHVVVVRRQQLRKYYAWLESEMKTVEETYTAFGLDLTAEIAAEQAEPEGGGGEII
jgi:hypothetical protein